MDEHAAPVPMADEERSIELRELTAPLAGHLKLLIVGPLIAGLVAFAISYLIPPTFTATTTFMPPQQTQSSAAAALATLGTLGGLAASTSGLTNSGDRYVALMQSATVSDRLVDQFKLMDVYETKLRIDARKMLAENVRIALGKKDGLITVQVEDKSPERAADIANAFVVELRHITGTLAVTEAQQRRMFFERQLQESRDRLIRAQQTLESSGFNPGALKAEPRAAAEAYARLKAEATAAELRLALLRNSLADGAPEVRQQQIKVSVLREQLARSEQAAVASGDSDYIGRYREFKYEETLFELYARQFELARADESREGALIQVVDAATPPERKSKPKRAMVAVGTTLVTLLLLLSGLVLRARFRSDRPTGAIAA